MNDPLFLELYGLVKACELHPKFHTLPAPIRVAIENLIDCWEEEW